MATQGRRTDTCLGERIYSEGHGFRFFQAVRMLERLRPGSSPVGRDALPGGEAVRFRGNHSLAFPPREIDSIEQQPDRPPQMTVSFMGLTGRQGILPFHYTEFVIDRRVAKRDRTPAAFFDLFLHRLVSFFHRAWEKHSIAIQYERAEAGVPDVGETTVHSMLLDLVGAVAEEGGSRRSELPQDSLAFYSGLIAQRPHSASALEGLLRDYFRVGVKVEQFRGKWFALDPDECTDMVEPLLKNRLGEGAVLGDEVWNPQSRIRLQVGPLRWRQYRDFMPGGSAFERLTLMARFFLDASVDFDIQLILLKGDVPSCRLTDEGLDPQRLGLSSWLKTSEFEQDARDVILSGVDQVGSRQSGQREAYPS